jgi:hypothetical protein
VPAKRPAAAVGLAQTLGVMEHVLPLLAGLLGALIGAAASIITVVVQARAQASRDRTKEAVALAVEDWKSRMEMMKQRGGIMYPLAVFIHYHTKLLGLAEKGELTPAAIDKLAKEQDALIQAIESQDERRRRDARQATANSS